MLSVPPDLARSALDAAPDAMIIMDAAGVVRFANRQVSALFGYSHDELIGQRVEMLMPERFRTQHASHRECYNNNPRVRPMGRGLALFGQRRNGTEFSIEISLSPIDSQDTLLIAAAVRDVSDRKRVEDELIVARESAEKAREAAERANQVKSRFLATASHDLRQPLQTLALLNGSLRRMVTDPNLAEALSQQEQAISATSRLLSTLLDISKLESGAIKPQPTDFAVARLFEELRHDFMSVASKKGLQLDIGRTVQCIHSDPSLVEQILRNLISNAIKYTREGWVRVRCLLEEPSVRIDVLDTGVGIPGDKLSYIYDEFYQVGVPPNGSREGYGLGLSIVQRIVKLLDLQLVVRSEVGKGSQFSLYLPTSGAEITASPVNQEEPRRGQHQIGAPHILLVEDDPGVRDATLLLLKVEGYRVTAASSLTEALQKLQQDAAVDLLLTDYHLTQGETGIQVIASLRDTLKLPIKAVLMTGDTSSAIKELPLDPLLRIASKPIKAEELLTLMRALLAA